MAMTNEPTTEAGGMWPTLGWAGYLASAWTWVIGLLWPALLVRDFGLWGWVAFAVPNVLGAGAFGFVLSRPGVSQAVVARHGEVARRFSEVTVAFHVFAGGWVLWALAGVNGVLLGAGVALVTAMVGWGQAKALAWVGLAALGVSVGLGVGWLTLGSGEADASWAAATTHASNELRPVDLVWLSPALVFGFVLSPYLDLTFHRARQALTPRSGKAAFGIGFGVFFLLMIVFSLLYSWQMLHVFKDNKLFARVPPVAGWVLLVHIALQSGLTTGFHLNEIAQQRGHAGLHRTLAYVAAGGALAYWAIQWFHLPAFEQIPAVFHLNPGEAVYRCFILFYGLVFPAYVWLVMLPTRRAVTMRAKVIIWLITVVVTLPMAFYAFVGERFWLIGGVLALLVAARVLVMRWPGAAALRSDGDDG